MSFAYGDELDLRGIAIYTSSGSRDAIQDSFQVGAQIWHGSMIARAA